MNLSDIIIFSTLAIVVRLLLSRANRTWVIFYISIAAVFWLQPVTPIRYFDFWFPVLTLSLVVLVWLIVTPREKHWERDSRIGLFSLAALILVVAATRYLGYDGIITPSRPPQMLPVAVFLFVLGGLFFLLMRFSKGGVKFQTAAIVLILLLFLGLKVPWFSEQISAGLRALMSQSTSQASALDLRWLGYSYTAFRLIHVLRDSQKGRIKAVSLPEFTTYTVFFPAFTAGPIDRLERFSTDLEKPSHSTTEDFVEGSRRLVLGLLKKFVLADTLSILALNSTNAVQVQHSGWAWIMLYAYAFQIYLDFSGYTDIAIGIGRYLGIRLPENFNRPYVQQNLTTFWNNWHMTLTLWFRAYFFNPITRSLRKNGRLSQSAILLLTQLATMVLIGMWHGITWNFLLWGAWHGVGLFFQNRWSEWARKKWEIPEEKKALRTGMMVINILLTFHYIALGWVWFALSDPGQSFEFLLKLFGVM